MHNIICSLFLANSDKDSFILYTLAQHISSQCFSHKSSFKAHLVVGSLLLLGLLLKPILLDRRSAGLAGLALDLGNLRLVGLELAGNVGLFGGGGGLGNAELLHVALGVVGLDSGSLVGLQLAKVEVLNQVG